MYENLRHSFLVRISQYLSVWICKNMATEISLIYLLKSLVVEHVFCFFHNYFLVI